MNKHIEVIGVDHGWSAMKTVSQVFTTGVKEITTEPAFFDDVVEFEGAYYKVGGKRLEVRDLKIENDNFYILTLAAAAKELNRRGMRNQKVLELMYVKELYLWILILMEASMGTECCFRKYCLKIVNFQMK